MTTDYNYTPDGFPPAPVIDGERWYYVQTGTRLAGDRVIDQRGDLLAIVSTTVGEPLGIGAYAIIRRVPASEAVAECPVCGNETKAKDSACETCAPKIGKMAGLEPATEAATKPVYTGPFLWHAVPESEAYLGICKACGGRWVGGKHSTVCEACYVKSKPVPTPAPDYPAGLPVGLVKVESGALAVNDAVILPGKKVVYISGVVSEFYDGAGTVEEWINRGAASAVYRKPEAKPDHFASAGKMMDQSGNANEMVAKLTAENTRLADALKQAKIGESWADEQFEKAKGTIRELEAEIDRLKAPVDVEEFGEISPVWEEKCGGEYPDGIRTDHCYVAFADLGSAMNSTTRKHQRAMFNLFLSAPRLLREVVELRADRDRESIDDLRAKVAERDAEIVRLIEEAGEVDAELAAITGHLVRAGLIWLKDDGKPNIVSDVLAKIPDDQFTKIANAMRQFNEVTGYLSEATEIIDAQTKKLGELDARVKELETPDFYWPIGDEENSVPHPKDDIADRVKAGVPFEYRGAKQLAKEWWIQAPKPDATLEDCEYEIRLATPEEIAAKGGGK